MKVKGAEPDAQNKSGAELGVQRAEIVSRIEDTEDLENLIKTENFESGINSDLPDGKDISAQKVFGKLLRELREDRQIQTLLLCREISKIEQADRNVNIFADSGTIEQINSNGHAKIIEEFFKSYNFCVAFMPLKKEDIALKNLKDMLDDKLVIK